MKFIGIVRLYRWGRGIFSRYEIAQTAAGIAYYLVLAVFPFLMFLTALAGMLNISKEKLIGIITPFFGAEAQTLLLRYYGYLTAQKNMFSLLFGLGFALYSAARAVSALTCGIRKVCGAKVKRSLVSGFVYAILFAVGISGVLMVSLGVVSLLTLIGFSGRGWVYATSAVAVFLVLTAFYAAAHGGKRRLRYVLPGSLFAFAALHFISIGIGIYVRLSANFSVVYGSIGAVILMLLWLYMFAVSMLLGALINRYSEIKNMPDKR